MTDPLAFLGGVPVIGILRKCPPELAVPVASAAADAGLVAIEVTLDSEDALGQIGALAELGSALVVGVGSVLDAAAARAAIDVGARFVVAPIVDEDTVAACVERGVPVFPGAATPSEIHRARILGATAVKVFPAAQLGGPAYIRAIASPLGSPPMIPTGGVEADHVRAYLDAGAVAVGAGGALFPSSALASGDLTAVTRRAAAWVEAAR